MMDNLNLPNVKGIYCGSNRLGRANKSTRILIKTDDGIPIDGVVPNDVVNSLGLNNRENIGIEITVDLIRANKPALASREENMMNNVRDDKKDKVNLELLGISQNDLNNNEDALANDLNEPSHEENEEGANVKFPIRQEQYVQRLKRDSEIVKKLKKKYDDKCQICGCQIKLNKRNYSEGHHLKPLGSPHNGPDIEENIIIVCPNCHVKFDFNAKKIDYSLQTIKNLGREYIDYHNDLVEKEVEKGRTNT